MAEVAERIDDRFITKECNSAGIFLVTFYVNGLETPVIVDDYFPVNPSGELAFSNAKDGEFWVPIMEKAWAKLHGSYMAIDGGFPLKACIHLEGVPGFSLQHGECRDDEDKVTEFWETLISSDSRNYTITTYTDGNEG